VSTTVNARRSESYHWYYPDGRPCYELPKKTGGGMKNTTLADARELGLLPGVSTLLKVLHKPALQDWIIAQAVKAVLDTPRMEGEDNNTFVDRVLVTERIQDQEAKKAADLGADIHDALEEAIQGRPYPDKFRPYVLPVLDKLQEMGKVVWSEKHLVGSGYAGRADALLDDGTTLTLPDFKSTKSMPKKESWIDHRMQTAFYAACLGNVADRHIVTANIYISTVNPGEVAVFKQEDWQNTYKEACEPILQYWRWANNYFPVCDLCNDTIPDGSPAVAVTMWRSDREETPGNWEKEYSI
jgi:hypothetical protein